MWLIGTAEQAAEKLSPNGLCNRARLHRLRKKNRIHREIGGLIPSGAKALLISKQLTYGLKPVPSTD
jgi:hypothetical protein